MPSVRALSAVYANFMLSPRRGRDVCDICFNFTDGHSRCYACARSQQWLDAFAPISYSVDGEQLHHALAGYKRIGGQAGRRLGRELAAVLWRHLERHERCLAQAAGAVRFAIVTAVPSADPRRDRDHPLHKLLADVIGPTRDRYEPLLCRTARPTVPRTFDRHRYETVRSLAGEHVLLIDDTWTSGASAQSAAAALKLGGAGIVAAVTIGRHVHRQWRGNDRRLRSLQTPFDWAACPLCAIDQAEQAA